ncbi:PEP-CTERM system histidine kinase PrsK [Seongchinamella sediminis]|uniref:histidine kinase n=1 Tax=Seongchinamella sediminis TaxID=2283635 RepID=A0A3L7DTN6_9GAMM|nr:XrtA/PEP-CTERM system histidine kinase PrsK [Seongchinamella sediminis]RLQ20744.1 PEP-CTERM system histidine kinase PrsK [Seongchinamella sediminis]
MQTNIGLYSYGAALIAYSLLTGLAFLHRSRHSRGQLMAVASGLTALWAGTVVISALLPYPQVKLMQSAEVARNAAWCFFLLQTLRLKLHGSGHWLESWRWIPWFIGAIATLVALIFSVPSLAKILSFSDKLYLDIAFAAWLGMALLGLLLLEQLYRNSTQAERWSLKFLCLGLGFIFAYDFFMYAEALLFRQLDRNLWQARGLVIALAALPIAIALGRSSRLEEQRGLHVSRHVVFYSATLLASGVYLILMALVGYYLQFLGGNWGAVLQIAFLCAAGFLLLALLFSGQARAKTRVWLSKNFFSYKYDYRNEWLKFTDTLATGGENIPENIVRAMANLCSSPAGLLWARTEQGTYNLIHRWDMALDAEDTDLTALAPWLESSGWIIDMREWRQSPDLYNNMQLPTVVKEIPGAWLIIPLFFADRLQGILLLRESELIKEINWEDRDLLKLAGRQAASHLAQYQADKALVESRQFEAFNRLSAYVIHDLKNILAQQSLMVSNAKKHRENPEFVDDMIETVENSVQRMTRLMAQMRSGLQGREEQALDMNELLSAAVEERRKTAPPPRLELPEGILQVRADRDQLMKVCCHIIQNAQEATDKSGEVTVRLKKQGGDTIVEIEDNGTGMEDEFVAYRLFKPFDSTKGLTGMGIGAFESREIVRNLGGDILVRSKPGEGSLFAIRLPRYTPTGECQSDIGETAFDQE